MATAYEPYSKDQELKTQFATREGIYRLMTIGIRPKTGLYNNGNPNTPVRVSFVEPPKQPHASSEVEEIVPKNDLKLSNGNDDSPEQLYANVEKICLNTGKELYVHPDIRSHRPDLTKPIDKRVYKGTFPTCHDFNSNPTKPDSVLLLVGFTGGQVQLLDPIRKEISKLYNEERLIDKTRVTCLKWVPQSPQQFLVSHSSGQIYLYNEDLPSGATPPHYQLFKQGYGYSVHTCKAKSTRNPLYRWVLGPSAGTGPPPPAAAQTNPSNSVYSCPVHNQSTTVHHHNPSHNHNLSSNHQRHHSTSADSSSSNQTTVASPQPAATAATAAGVSSSSSSGGFFPFSSSASSANAANGAAGGAASQLVGCGQPGPAINQFAFSPCGRFLAVVSQDGYLRVFDYHKMELLGQMRSYFGGLLCCAWSPDGRFVAVGGEDDLVTVWALAERQVVCRCQGHRSWVNVVQFDPYLNNTRSSKQHAAPPARAQAQAASQLTMNGDASPNSAHSDDGDENNVILAGKTYRLGSVGQDTQLCLWEVSEDAIRQGLRASSAHCSSAHCPACLSANANAWSGADGASTSGSGSPRASPAAAPPVPNHKEGGTGLSLTARLASFALGSGSKTASASASTGAGTGAAVDGASAPAGKEHRRNFSLGGKAGQAKAAGGGGQGGVSWTLPSRGPAAGIAQQQQQQQQQTAQQQQHAAEAKLLGTFLCPRLDDVPLLEPLVCKKVAQERLTELLFRQDCLIVACQEGYVYTWSRPGVKPLPVNSIGSGSSHQHNYGGNTGIGGGGSSHHSSALPNTDGTVV